MEERQRPLEAQGKQEFPTPEIKKCGEEAPTGARMNCENSEKLRTISWKVY
jgi:hypothetical protein